MLLQKKKLQKENKPEGISIFPRTPLNRPEKPLRFFWTFPAKIEAAQNFQRTSVGVDANIDPAGCTGFTEIFGKFATSQRADVGIGPYRTPANSYCSANFERKAFLPQILNRNDSQICCTVTGGAYHSGRKVTWCVRNDYKIGAYLNCTRSRHQPRPSAPFLPILFRQDGKEWAVGDTSERASTERVPINNKRRTPHD